MEFILAVDPGGVSGVAWLVDGEFDSTEVHFGRHGFYLWFDTTVKINRPNLVICEDFIISAQTAKKTPQPDAHRIIGWLDGWCTLNDTVLKLQTPATGKGFGTNAKLDHLGWRKGGAGHADDAARHLLTALRDHATIRERLRGLGA